MEYSEDQVNHILEKYKCQREKDKVIYQKKKENPEFVKKNRERAKQHYHKNPEMKQKYYEANKELQLAKSSYHYYLKNNNIEKFKTKRPERYELLLKINYFKDQNPSLSTTTSPEEEISSSIPSS